MTERITRIAEEESWDVKFSRAICSAARTHLDMFMGEGEWTALGFNSLFSDLEIPTQFHWTVYVNPSKTRGFKQVGIKLFNSTGCFDAYEVQSQDANIPLSDKDHQNYIDQEMSALAEVEVGRKNRVQAEKVAVAEQERGFPAGAYRLVADFPIKNGTRYQMIAAHEFRVGEFETAEQVAQHVRGSAVMAGFHNYTLDVLHPRRYATVKLALTREGVPDILYELKINASGHLASEDDLKHHVESESANPFLTSDTVPSS